MEQNAIVLSGPRWFSVKWWATNGREDLGERASISVETLRQAGFIARVGERRNEARHAYAMNHPKCGPDAYATLIRVEVYGTSETHERARDHLRGFWAALESRGLKADYAEGFGAGVCVLRKIGKSEPSKLPAIQNLRRLKA